MCLKLTSYHQCIVNQQEIQGKYQDLGKTNIGETVWNGITGLDKTVFFKPNLPTSYVDFVGISKAISCL